MRLFQVLFQVLSQALHSNLPFQHAMTKQSTETNSHLCGSTFDTKRLTKLLGPNQSRAGAIVSILNNVIANHYTPIHEIRDALLHEQPAQAAHVVHNLKGCIANLGGMRVFEAAGIFEEQLRNGIPYYKATGLLDALEQELGAFLREAKKWLQNTHLSPTTQSQVAVNDFQLQQFKQHLQDNNLLACDNFESMHSYLQRYLSEKEFNLLRHSMEQMDFKAASHLLESINIHRSQ